MFCCQSITDYHSDRFDSSPTGNREVYVRQRMRTKFTLVPGTGRHTDSRDCPMMGGLSCG